VVVAARHDAGRGPARDADPLAELRAYVLENPDASIKSLREIFHLSYRRVVAYLDELEARGEIARGSVVRGDGSSYPARIAQGKGQAVLRSELDARYRALAERAAGLAVEELSLALPPESKARAEKRVVAVKADAVATGRMVVSARWLLGLLDARAGRAGDTARRRVLALPAEARGDTCRVELVVLRGVLIDTRVAVDATWLAELVGRSRRSDDGFELGVLLCGLPDVARARTVAQELVAVATGAPALVEVDARWLSGVVAGSRHRAGRRAG
jgi:hypothetical protein